MGGDPGGRRTCAVLFGSATVIPVRTGSDGSPLWGKSVSDSNGYPNTTENCGKLADVSLKWPKPRRKAGLGSCDEL